MTTAMMMCYVSLRFYPQLKYSFEWLLHSVFINWLYNITFTVLLSLLKSPRTFPIGTYKYFVF